MNQDVTIVAARLLQGLGKEGHPSECAVVVDSLGNLPHGAVVPQQPVRVNRDRAKRVTENIMEQSALPAILFVSSSGCSLCRGGGYFLRFHLRPFLLTPFFPRRQPGTFRQQLCSGYACPFRRPQGQPSHRLPNHPISRIPTCYRLGL